MSCGASVGRNYGPVVVSAREDLDIDSLAGRRVAVPGEHTTSWMLFQIFAPAEVTPLFVDFDEVEGAVKSGLAGRWHSPARGPNFVPRNAASKQF